MQWYFCFIAVRIVLRKATILHTAFLKKIDQLPNKNDK